MPWNRRRTNSAPSIPLAGNSTVSSVNRPAESGQIHPQIPPTRHFSNYRELLEKRSTYRRYQDHLPFYVIYCVGEYSFRKWKVAWMEQQDPASFRCSVIADSRSSITPNKRVVPDHKLYFVDADTREEAHYLAGYLNSHPVRTWLGGFLHGKQIATTVFEFMHVPKYDENNADHRRLALISLTAHRHRAGSLNTNFLAPEQEEQLTALVRTIAAKQT